jgi:hypothetical protein
MVRRDGVRVPQRGAEKRGPLVLPSTEPHLQLHASITRKH